jgi:UDP:flavonoid glycosyltransferase YjiC (YdhE family)
MAAPNPMKLVLFCSGSAGDVLPFIELGAALVGRGHEVHLVTHHGYAERAARAGVPYEAFDTEKQYAAFLEDGNALNDPRRLPTFLRKHSFPRIADVLRLVRKYATSDTALITSPTFDTVSRIVREAMRLPVLWMFMAPVQVAQWPLQKKMREAMYRRVLGSEIDRVRSDLGMSPVEDWGDWLRYSASSIGQWPLWFAAPDEDWLPGVQPIGFLLGESGTDPSRLTPEVLQRLEESPRPPLLITGGTGRYLNERFFALSIDAARALGAPAIVVTRDRDLLPAKIAEDVWVVDRLPFAALMPRCRAVIHHGGIGTVGTAAAAGTPQLVLASGADRPDNGARVEALGIGRHHLLARSTLEDLLDALTEMEGDEVRSRCEVAARQIEEHNAAETGCLAIEDLVAESRAS